MTDQFVKIINQVVAKRCSDLYCLPKPDSYYLQALSNGKTVYSQSLSLENGQRFLAFLKYQGNMAVSEHRRPQAGALVWNSSKGETINIRLSSVGNFLGQESMVIRFIYALDSVKYHLLAPPQWTLLREMLTHRGLFLLAGPMGSGKTTTMYRLARSFPAETVIMTIEDPVEITEPRFLQLQVNELAGMDYTDLLRVGLRHRPDIFIIGEIRDSQTAVMAIRAALSGHLVLATIHARDVYGVIARLRQLEISSDYLHSAISGIGYQRLLPTTKNHCAVLFDFLGGQDLKRAIDKPGKVGMTSEWGHQLQVAISKNIISQKTANQFKEG